MPFIVKLLFPESNYGSMVDATLPLQLLLDSTVVSTAEMNSDGIAVFPIEATGAKYSVRIDTQAMDKINEKEDAIAGEHHIKGKS